MRLALFILVLLVLALAGAWLLFWRRLALRRALERARQLEGTSPLEQRRARAALLGFDELEATLAQVELFGRTGAYPELLLDAIELLAVSPDARDPGVSSRLEAIGHDEGATPEQRFTALYALEELDAPRFPREPPRYAKTPWVSVREDRLPFTSAVQFARAGTTYAITFPSTGLDQVRLSEARIVDRPWRALLRIAQRGDASVRVAGTVVTLEARRTSASLSALLAAPDLLQAFEEKLGRAIATGPQAELALVPKPPSPDRSVEPLKALRALAALSRCGVQEPDGSTLALVKL